MKTNSGKLFVSWVILYIITAVICKIYIAVFQNANGYSPISILGGYHYIICALILFVFIPLLYYAQKLAKKEKNKGILIASRIFLFHHVLCAIVTIAYIVQQIC